MGKWWLLSTAAVLWMASGYVLVRSGTDEVSSVRQSQTPARIVSMAPNLTEILFALGLEPNVVGVTQDSDYPPAARDKPRVGTFWQPSVEAVIATRPDLVVTQTFEQQKDLARRLQRMGYRSLMVDVDTIAGLFDGILAIGEATGAARQAQTLCEDMRTEIDRLATATAGQRRVKVLWVVQREPLRVAGRATFVNEMIELAGGENAIGATLHVYPAIGAEQVIATGPEVIIEPAMLPGSDGPAAKPGPVVLEPIRECPGGSGRTNLRDRWRHRLPAKPPAARRESERLPGVFGRTCSETDKCIHPSRPRTLLFRTSLAAVLLIAILLACSLVGPQEVSLKTAFHGATDRRDTQSGLRDPRAGPHPPGSPGGHGRSGVGRIRRDLPGAASQSRWRTPTSSASPAGRASAR